MTAASFPNISALKLSSLCNSNKGLGSAAKSSLGKFESQLAVGASYDYSNEGMTSGMLLPVHELTFLRPSGADGNCLFHSLLTLLEQKGMAGNKTYADLRKEIVAHMRRKSNRFSQSIVPQERSNYLNMMANDTVWGTEREIDAAADLYNLVIHIWILERNKNLSRDASYRTTYYPENQEVHREDGRPVDCTVGVHLVMPNAVRRAHDIVSVHYEPAMLRSTAGISDNPLPDKQIRPLTKEEFDLLRRKSERGKLATDRMEQQRLEEEGRRRQMYVEQKRLEAVRRSSEDRYKLDRPLIPDVIPPDHKMLQPSQERRQNEQLALLQLELDDILSNRRDDPFRVQQILDRQEMLRQKEQSKYKEKEAKLKELRKMLTYVIPYANENRELVRDLEQQIRRLESD